MLEPFGLSADEEEVYLRLLASPAPVTWPCGAAKVLEGLRGRGLAVRDADGAWSAMPPDIAVELLIRARESELHRARRVTSTLMELHRFAPLPRDDRVEPVVGTEAIRARYLTMVASAGLEWASFDKPPYIHPSRDDALELDALRRGVVVRKVYERDTLASRLSVLERLVSAGEQVRVLPLLPFKLMIVDRRWGLVPTQHGDEVNRALLVRRSPLLDALQIAFDTHWDQALPLRATTGPAAVLEEIDRNLLGLLAAGVTDQAIARHLNIGLRTVQRRVSALMRQLGANTRFQAGLQAGRRGLL